MPFSYKKLLKLMIDRDISKGQLRQALGISQATLAKLAKDEFVSLEVLDKICEYLNCEIEDILEHIKKQSM